MAISSHDPTRVAAEVQEVYREMFSQGDPLFVPRVFGWAIDWFTGQYKDYQPVDARYHDLEHTLQGTVCLVRLLRGRSRAHAEPPLDDRTFRLVILAMLFHDTGYLKHRSDTEGTGAKYTITHVARSAAFAAEFLGEKQFAPADIQAVCNMICCTGVETNVHLIPFAAEIEKIAGFALATADLLGQMAADDYVQKLPMLFAEFEEAVRFSGNTGHYIARFQSASDLIARTPMFWERLVLPKLEHDFRGLYRYLNQPYPDGENAYLSQIQKHMEQIRNVIATRTEGVRIN